MMAKRPTVSPREQEVLESPDGFICRVMVNGGWEESIPFDATQALDTKKRILGLGYRVVMIYAVRTFGHELRMAFATDAFVSAYSELGYNGNK